MEIKSVHCRAGGSWASLGGRGGGVGVGERGMNTRFMNEWQSRIGGGRPGGFAGCPSRCLPPTEGRVPFLTGLRRVGTQKHVPCVLTTLGPSVSGWRNTGGGRDSPPAPLPRQKRRNLAEVGQSGSPCPPEHHFPPGIRAYPEEPRPTPVKIPIEKFHSIGLGFHAQTMPLN